jgi:predicted amidohydrolase YtcJ
MMRKNSFESLKISILPSVAFISATLFLSGCGKEASQDSADIVLINGGIYTVDAIHSWKEAAAIRDGFIIAIVTNNQIEKYIDPATKLIDLSGRMAMPGMHDSHIHPLEGAYEQVYCNLWDADSVEAVISTLQNCGWDNDSEWFQAVGLSLDLFGIDGPDKSMLEGIAPGKYIFIDGSDGHAALVNDKALGLAEYDANTPNPVGGVIERRESGELSGTVRETARDAVDKHRPPRNLDVSIAAMRDAVKLMHSFGITSVYDAWVGEHEMQTYAALSKEGELNLRVLGGVIDEGVFEKHSGEDFERVVREREKYESENVSFNSIKIMVDGVIEGETGALLKPYTNVDHDGVLNHSPEELRQRVSRFYSLGMQLHFHTIGDGAVRAALDAIQFARAQGDDSRLNNRHTLSHLSLIDPEDIPRFGKLNTGASFTMVWGYPNEWTTKLEVPVLGRERVSQMYPIRSVHEAGGIVLGGSDWNYGELNPLLSIETGITRSNPFAPSNFKVISDEFVSLSTMIDAYTINGAWQMQSEDISGSIEVGKRADISIFDHNLFEIEISNISETVVDLTIFDGRIVFDRTQQ